MSSGRLLQGLRIPGIDSKDTGKIAFRFFDQKNGNWLSTNEILLSTSTWNTDESLNCRFMPRALFYFQSFEIADGLSY